MRLPITSEADAFRAVCVLGAASALSVGLGVLIVPLAGIVAFALLLAALVAWELRSEDPERSSRLREAHRVGHDGHHEPRTLLIAAATPVGGADTILPHHDEPRTVEVLAPVLQSRTHFVTTDIDHEREDARRRLVATLAWARGHGVDAHGLVGDPIDPLASLADELREFDVDELVVTTEPSERAGWVELGLLEHLRHDLDVPVIHVVIDGARAEPAAR